MLGGKLVVGVLVLTIASAMGVPIDVTLAGHALERSIARQTDAALYVPDNVSVETSALQLSPLHEISGVPYLYQRRIALLEPAGVGRTNEYVDLSLSLAGMRSDCKDVMLLGPDPIAYQRVSCSAGTIVLRAVVPSIAGSGTLYWWVRYGNPDDSVEKSRTVTGGYTTTHTSQTIGGCSSQASHCATASIGTSSCQGPTMFTAPYPVRVMDARCSSGRVCGTGCSGACSITDWTGDTGTRVYGAAAGSTSCPTAIMGGFDHAFQLDWSRLLSATLGPQEYANTSISFSYDGTPLLEGDLTGPTNITLALTPGNHTLSFNATGPVLMSPFIRFYQNQTINADPVFTTDRVQYAFTIASDIPVFSASFTTPDVADPNSTRAFAYSHGAWSIAEGSGDVTVSFSTARHNLTLSDLSSLLLEFRRLGVPASRTSRACFEGTCYLEYSNTTRTTGPAPVFNPDDPVIATLTTDRPALCTAGSVSIHTENNTCILQLSPATTRVQTFNETDWSAGYLDVNLTTRTLSVRLEMPASGTASQSITFSGRAEDSTTHQGVNGTALIVLYGSGVRYSTYADVTDGRFQGSLTLPESGTHSVRAIVLDPPLQESLWGAWSGLVSVIAAPQPSLPASVPTSRGGGGGGGSSSITLRPLPVENSTRPGAEFFTALYQAIALGHTSFVFGIQQDGQRCLMDDNCTGLSALTATLSDYVHQRERDEWELFKKYNESLFIYPEETQQLHAILLSVLEADADLASLRAFESGLDHDLPLREQGLRAKLAPPVNDIPADAAGLVAQCFQIVEERGTPQSKALFSTRRYTQAMDALFPTPIDAPSPVLALEPPASVTGPRVPQPVTLFLLACLPLLSIPASAAWHVQYWK